MFRSEQKKMHCRTCYDDIGIEDSHTLDELGWYCPQKTLAEIILEITGIDTKNQSTLEFQHLCDGCVVKIRNCFEFILRAQKVNAQLLQQYNQSVESSYLEELPIDFPIPNCSIKTDIDDCETEKAEDVVDPTLDVKVEEFFPDPIVQLEEESINGNITDTSERVSNGQAAEECDEDYEEKRRIPIKRKRGRPRKTPNPAISGNVCDVCGKSFNWHKDLIRHAKSHSMEPELKCEYCERLFLRRDKLKDHMKTHFKNLSEGSRYRATKQTEWNFAKRLYGKPVLKFVQCKLCGNQFSRILELQQHILLHKDDPTTFSLKSVKTNTKDFSDLLVWQTECEIKSNICKDLAKSNFAPYYSIVNEFGYELNLSDSDETDGGQECAASIRNKYKCMLCSEVFNHQYKIFSHTLEAHLNEKLPLKCNVCKVQFVCSEMLRQHERRQCKNKARKFQCSHCPGKFMWAENFEQHQCTEKKLSKPILSAPSTRSKSNEARLETLISMRTTKKLQCGQCDKTFIWPKDLTRHMRMHLPDREKFQCSICQRRFNRKDNMQVHMKVHGEETTADSKKKECNLPKQAKTQAVDANLTIPNGCKVIECIICQSKQMRLSDLKVHLIQHQKDDSYVERWVSVEKIAESLYPELGSSLSKAELVNRITIDLASQHYERFYSVTNEIGYEMNLSSSETETETDTDSDGGSSKLRKTSASYICELCNSTFERKYKLFKHQSQSHQWDEAQYTCIHCNAKFVSSRLLNWHYNRQCKNTLKRFLCRKCPLRFMWKDNLDAHVRTAHSIEKSPGKKTLRAANDLRCTKCNRNFIMQKDLTRHLLMQSCCNESTEVLKCLYCPRKFYRKENLHAHMIRHGISSSTFATAECILRSSNKANGLKQIYCRICNIAFPRIDELRAHLLKETKSAISQHYTYDSPLNYTITNSLGFEMQLDDSETDGDNEQHITACNTISRPPYQCTICNLFAKRRYEMAQHQLSMHKYEQLPFKCERCIFRSVSQDILAQHMRSQCYNMDKKFQCDICQFKFMWSENLETHMRLYHYETKTEAQQLFESNALNVDTSSKAEQTIFQCDQCPCKYNRKDRLNAHIKKIHIGNSNESSIIAINKKKKLSQQSVADETKKAALEKKFLCAFCGRGLTSSSNLIIHMRRHTGEKPFKCDFCHMAFPRSSDLSAHRRKHTGEKPHACTICEKAFSRSYKLMLHMRTHTGERPHKCTYCEKSFTQSNDLTLHIRRHTGERPYICGVCGERFIQGTALKNHRMMRGHYEETEDALPI